MEYFCFHHSIRIHGHTPNLNELVGGINELNLNSINETVYLGGTSNLSNWRWLALIYP